MFQAWQSGGLRPGDLRELIPDIWLYLDPPAGTRGPLNDSQWLELFTATGYFVGPPYLAFNLTDPMRLFRAAPSERTQGMSWCTHRAMAERFVPRHSQWGEYKVWSADVPRTAILATLCRVDDTLFDQPFGSVREIVVDPRGLPPVLRCS